MDILGWLGGLFYTIVTQPLLNILQLWEKLTQDTGIAIFLTAATINLVTWKLTQDNYINSQKLKYLQPELEKIQEKYKTSPMELMQQRSEVLKKHNVTTGGFFILLLQIPVLISLYNIINHVVTKKEPLTGIYSWINADGIATFPPTAFGVLDLNAHANTLGWIGYGMVALVSLSSLLLGLYMFRWAPKANLPEPPKAKSPFANKNTDPNAPDFATTLQKSIEFQSIYVFPLLYLVINTVFPIGLVIYFFGSSFSGLIRQIGITWYYSKNGDKLLQSIIDSDPSLLNPKKVEQRKPVDPSEITDVVATKVLPSDKKTGKKPQPRKKRKTSKGKK